MDGRRTSGQVIVQLRFCTTGSETLRGHKISMSPVNERQFDYFGHAIQERKDFILDDIETAKMLHPRCCRLA